MDRDFINKLYFNQHACPNCTSPEVVAVWFNDLLGTLFPEFSKQQFSNQKEFELHLEKLKLQLDQILLRNPIKPNAHASETAERFFEELEHIHTLNE